MVVALFALQLTVQLFAVRLDDLSLIATDAVAADDRGISATSPVPAKLPRTHAVAGCAIFAYVTAPFAIVAGIPPDIEPVPLTSGPLNDRACEFMT